MNQELKPKRTQRYFRLFGRGGLSNRLLEKTLPKRCDLPQRLKPSFIPHDLWRLEAAPFQNRALVEFFSIVLSRSSKKGKQKQRSEQHIDSAKHQV